MAWSYDELAKNSKSKWSEKSFQMRRQWRCWGIQGSVTIMHRSSKMRNERWCCFFLHLLHWQVDFFFFLTTVSPACQWRRCKRFGFNPWVGKIPWRRKWQPTPVFLPGEFHGRRSLVGYSPWCPRVGHDWAAEQHGAARAISGQN